MKEMKKIFLLVMIVALSGAAFASPTPYGPGYGFNTAPDLGRVLTLDELQGKVSYEWFHNRFRTLFSRHSELQDLDPAQWAQDAYQLARSGQFVENSLPVGALIKDVSFTGGEWSANRIWTAAPGQTKAPQGVWDLSMISSDGIALKIVIAKRCGNLQYIGLDRVVKAAPPEPMPPVVQEPGIPQREITLRVPPTAYFYGQYRAPASSQARVFQPKPVTPVSSLPRMRINNGNNISLSQSQSQSQNQTQNQPTRSVRISTFATGGEGFGAGYGSADAAASASGSASATAVGAASGGGPGGGGDAAVGTSTADSTSTSTGTATDSGGYGGGYGGSSGILIEGEW